MQVQGISDGDSAKRSYVGVRALFTSVSGIHWNPAIHGIEPSSP
jgi:hypothetical protein